MELLISAGQVLTGPATRRIVDGAVLVSGGVVLAAGPEDEIARRAGPDVPRLSFPDSTVLPGLIDCHVHLAFDGGSRPDTEVRAGAGIDLLLGMAARARTLVDSGVTTVRDLGDRGGLAVRLREAIADGTLPGPRILSATAPITVPGGHCDFLGGAVEGPEQARDAVLGNANAGADVIKLMITGGGRDGWRVQLGPAELAAAVRAAREAGLPVAAHAHGTDGIAAAVEVGVDTIEHCTWLAEDGFDVRPELAAAIAERGIFVCPGVSPTWRGLPNRFGPDRAGEMSERIRWMHEQGIRLIAGTDAGVPRAGFDGMVASLEFYARLGLPNADILDMATVTAAEALGIGDTTGRLDPGYRADLLIVHGDPLADLDALRELRLVLADGRCHLPGSSLVKVIGQTQNPAQAPAPAAPRTAASTRLRRPPR